MELKIIEPPPEGGGLRPRIKMNKENENNDIWVINFPILSTSCPFSGRLMASLFPFGELVKDRCHHPMNPRWFFWAYPKCEKDSCPIKLTTNKL